MAVKVRDEIDRGLVYSKVKQAQPSRMPRNTRECTLTFQTARNVCDGHNAIAIAKFVEVCTDEARRLR